MTDYRPVISLAIEGVEAVAKVRKVIGTTYPNEAAPGIGSRRFRAPNHGIVRLESHHCRRSSPL